jgi:hypothetical protein
VSGRRAEGGSLPIRSVCSALGAARAPFPPAYEIVGRPGVRSELNWRVWRRRVSSLRRSRCTSRELRTLVLIFAGVAVPVLGAIAIQNLTKQRDLYNLVVRPETQSRNPPIIGWSGLTEKPCDCRVRILGYMMDMQKPVPDGMSVADFILVPDTGTLLHPPHQIPEEMIDIHLRAGRATRFKSRQLVWAEGLLTSCYVSNRGAEPLYCLTDASVLNAAIGDINRFFRHP